jgi:SAM-dependent methyltransferase
MCPRCDSGVPVVTAVPGWAEPLHAAVLERAGTGALLDLGCGAGEFARYATDRGATVTGVDLDRSAVAAAAAHVPEATFQVGDALDPPPGPFAAVVALQLLEHVANPVAVLRAAPAPVVVATVWGRESECDARLFAEALAPWLPPRPPRPGPPPLTDPDRLRKIVALAGLDVEALDEVECPIDHADDDALVGELLVSGIGLHAARQAGPAAVRAAVLDRAADLRTADGGYRLRNVIRVVVARRE